MMSNNTKPAIAILVEDLEAHIDKMGYKKVSFIKYLRTPEDITGELELSSSEDKKVL